MENTVIVGAQWGDEGKGKITNFLSDSFEYIARFAGGNNAGHTVVIGEKKYKLHHIPSGIFNSDKICVLGTGMVINFDMLKEEIDYLNENKISTKNLKISENAHLIMPYHISYDAYQESLRGENKLGTTGRGIGPAYVDKVARTGIRVIDLYDQEIFEQKLRNKFNEDEIFFAKNNLVLNEIREHFGKLAKFFKPYVTDTSILLNSAISKGKKILLEGAQGTLLDLDFGTYPFVTSSTTLSSGSTLGLGIPPYTVKKVMGIAKAYTTRIGTGPFPTEVNGDVCNYLREKGKEFGTTTSRPRRCGYLDLVILRYAVRLNGINSLAVTKLDVLDEMDKIKVAIAYKHKDKIIKEFPQSIKTLAECEPVYQELEGWKTDISSSRIIDDLPQKARNYINFIENILDIPVEIISIGPEKTQTISSFKKRTSLKYSPSALF